MLTHNLRCLLTLSISLIVAVLISDLADRSILSTAVLFLMVGFISGPALGNWIALNAGSIGISRFFEVSLSPSSLRTGCESVAGTFEKAGIW